MVVEANSKKVSLKGLSWNYSPAEIASKTDELIAKIEQVRSQINSVSVADAACDTVLLPFAFMEAETSALRYLKKTEVIAFFLYKINCFRLI